MWKVGACIVLCLGLSLHSVLGNGYYGGGGGEDSGAQAQPQIVPSGANSQAPSYPEYESQGAGTKDQDFWWLKNNPFQKPPNHPGVEKSAPANPSAPAPASAQPYGNQQPVPNSRPKPQPAIPAYGSQSQYNSGAFNPQPSRPQNYNNKPNAPQPAQPFNPAPGPSRTPYNQSPQPQVSPDCLLRNKADCHTGPAASLDTAQVGNVNYQQQQSFSGYPSDDSLTQTNSQVDTGNYQINIPVPQNPKPSPLSSNVLDQPQSVTFQLGQKPTEQKGFVSNESPYQPNNQQRPQPNQPYQGAPAQPGRPFSTFAASSQSSQTFNRPAPNPGTPYYGGSGNPQPQNDYSNKVAYQPPSLPYQEPQSQNNAQGLQPTPNNNYEEQPPYPGCPAAMLCVPESYCNSKGVSEGKPISLSPAEKLYRVALMACSAPETGVVGVCCRDPDYKDPWPNMGAGGGHEHQHGAFDDGQYHPPAPAYQSAGAQSGSPVNVQPGHQQTQPYVVNQGFQASASLEVPPLYQCKPDEECVEDFRCTNNGTISVDQSQGVSPASVELKKCKADFETLSFVCCRTELENAAPTTTPSPVSKPSEFTDPTTPNYTKNYLIQNTLGPTVSSLVTGKSSFPYVQPSNPNLRFSNPYRANERPIYLVTTAAPLTSPLTSTPSDEPSSTAGQPQPTAVTGNPYHSPDPIANEDSVEMDLFAQEPVPLKLVLRKEDEPGFKENASSILEAAQARAQEIISAIDQSQVEIGTTEEPIGTTDTSDLGNSTESSDQNPEFYYKPNPWSVDDEFNPPAPVPVPRQFYELPALPAEETPEEVPTTTLPPVDLDEPVFAIRTGFPPRKNFVEECPNSMKCLRESYCQESNPNEGSADVFDIRLSFRKGTPARLKCRQPNLPVDGVCCFLREDYMSQVTTHPLSIDIEPTVPLLPEEVCGVRHKKKHPDHETEYTEFGEFPWQALITAESKDKPCSGAILSNRVIATTASCLNNLTDAEIIIRVGEWDRMSLLETKPHQDLHVAAIIRHPKYIHSNYSYNVALIYTVEKIVFDYNVGRVCLPQPVSNFDGRACVLTGWGSGRRATQDSDRSNERYLLQAELRSLDSLECVQRLQKTSLGTDFKLPRTALCAGGESKRDTCNGDEGSPLTCESSTSGEYVLAGFLMGTSWGVNCDQPDVPGVFVNLPTVIEWMYNFLRQDPDSIVSSQQRFQKNKMRN